MREGSSFEQRAAGSLALAAKYEANLRSNPEFDISAHEQDAIEVERFASKILLEEFIAPYLQLLQKELVDRKGEKIDVRALIDEHLEKIRNAPDDESRIVFQKDLVEAVINRISRLPGASWDISIRHIVDANSMNCSAAASLLQVILESTQEATGITRVEYAGPVGHAMNIVTFEDGRIFYADPRNNDFEDVTDYVSIMEREGIAVYTMRKPHPRIPYRYLPVSSSSHNMLVGVFLDNVKSMHHAAQSTFDPIWLQQGGTPEQFEQWREEAAAALERADIAGLEQTIAERTANVLQSAMHYFYEGVEYKEDRRFFKESLQVQAFAREAIDLIHKQNVAIDKEKLLKFFLGEQDASETGNEKLDALLLNARRSVEYRWTVFDLPREDREAEIKKALRAL